MERAFGARESARVTIVELDEEGNTIEATLLTTQDTLEQTVAEWSDTWCSIEFVRSDDGDVEMAPSDCA